MAIALDTSAKNRSSSTSSASYSYTTTGANLLMLIGIWLPSDIITGVTYNGVALTQVGKANDGSGDVVYLYALVGPATGAHTVNITTSGSTTIDSAVATYTGVSQTGFPDATSTINLTGQGNFSKSLTTIANNCWLFAVTAQTIDNPTAGTGTVLRQDASTTNAIIADSNGAITPAGSASLAWNNAHTTNKVAGVIASFAPVSSTAWTKTLTETVTDTDTFTKAVTRILSDSVTNTATALKTAGRTLLEAFTNSDTFLEGKLLSSGPNSPATTADDATVGSIAWVNPNNAQVNDNVYATATGFGLSHYLKATNFSFSIPVGVTIQGILVEIERKQGTNVDLVADNSLKIVKSNGALGSTDKAAIGTIWPRNEAYASYGFSADLWGETWSYSDINNANFGVAISANVNPSGASATASIDHIRITVYYLQAGNIYTQTLTDAITAADALIKTATKALIEAVTNGDALTRSMGRTLSEASTHLDTLLKTAGRALTDAVTSSDAFAFLRTRSAVLSDTVTYADILIRTLARSFVEAFTNTDAFTGARVIPASFADGFTSADTLIKTAERVLSEAITSIDSLLRTLARLLIESVTNSDTLTGNRLRISTLTDSFSSLDTFIRSTTRSLIEVISSTDILGVSKVFVRAYSEAVTNTASFLKVPLRALVETVTSSDFFSRVWTAGRIFIETVTYLAAFRFLKNGSDVIWTNVAKTTAALANAAKHVVSLSTVLKRVSTWRNKDKS